MPPIEDELDSTESNRLLIFPRVFGGINLLVQMLPILAWGIFQRRFSIHYMTAIWDSLDLMLNGVDIDRARNRVTVVRHMKGRVSRPLSDFEQLLIERRDDGHYSLSLVGPSGPFELLTFRRYLDTRRSAERITTYLDFDIRDEALGPRILSRRSDLAEQRAKDREESSLADASAAETEETLASLLGGSANRADVLRIDHEENPGKSAISSMTWLVGSASIAVVAAWLVPGLIPLAAIFVAGSAAGALLLFLYSRRGVILVRDAEWFVAWRFFRISRFAEQLPRDRYTEVVLHAEQRFRGEDVNPYAERDEGELSYAISLDGRTEPLEIRLASDLASARKLGASVAKFAGLEFCDFTK